MLPHLIRSWENGKAGCVAPTAQRRLHSSEWLPQDQGKNICWSIREVRNLHTIQPQRTTCQLPVTLRSLLLLSLLGSESFRRTLLWHPLDSTTIPLFTARAQKQAMR